MSSAYMAARECGARGLCRRLPLLPPAFAGAFFPLVFLDGDFGPDTTRALQWKLSVDQDGDFGPDTKRALQRHLGVDADGDVGPVTVKALQRRVGVTQSGVWGAETTKGLQRKLNANTF